MTGIQPNVGRTGGHGPEIRNFDDVRMALDSLNAGMRRIFEPPAGDNLVSASRGSTWTLDAGPMQLRDHPLDKELLGQIRDRAAHKVAGYAGFIVARTSATQDSAEREAGFRAAAYLEHTALLRNSPPEVVASAEEWAAGLAQAGDGTLFLKAAQGTFPGFLAGQLREPLRLAYKQAGVGSPNQLLAVGDMQEAGGPVTEMRIALFGAAYMSIDNLAVGDQAIAGRVTELLAQQPSLLNQVELANTLGRLGVPLQRLGFTPEVMGRIRGRFESELAEGQLGRTGLETVLRDALSVLFVHDEAH